MIKEALEYISGLKAASLEPIVKEINGKIYCNQRLERYDEMSKARCIQATTLTALVDYIKNKKEEMSSSMIIHVVNPSRVQLYSSLNGDRDREFLFEVNAEIPQFKFDTYYDQERFLIELQANFQTTTDLEAILKVAGNVEIKATANYGDTGVSQKTVIKQGVASKVDVLVPNPVQLTPYRTFLEVEQPFSQFIFRIKEDDSGKPNFKLVEAEGGLWRYQSMRNIKMYLEGALTEEEKGFITIIA